MGAVASRFSDHAAAHAPQDPCRSRHRAGPGGPNAPNAPNDPNDPTALRAPGVPGAVPATLPHSSSTSPPGERAPIDLPPRGCARPVLTPGHPVDGRGCRTTGRVPLVVAREPESRIPRTSRNHKEKAPASVIYDEARAVGEVRPSGDDSSRWSAERSKPQVRSPKNRREKSLHTVEFFSGKPATTQLGERSGLVGVAQVSVRGTPL